ncbi:hypothetical protein IB238_07755 [Rhizobium sp. ARZ01]|uniref:hypothetical protein n=1 Tax=Rhizobium sp. ARZ01 TaxID=2769313 RepID=UPI00177F1676|nr:hypothetical protein [Rhizobium sp. ARZ01]MBD9372512.1 hypothetical protein [Rhizobium sp. ARZ01]
MTQIVTVSPTTAAYASQGYKATTRASTLFEQKIEAWSEAAKIDGDARVKAYLTLIKPPALALALLTMKRQPDVSAEVAERRYAENAGDAQGIVEPNAIRRAER